MKKTSVKIVFFGSGPVAAASLASQAHIFEIECVITKQAPAHHRGSVPVIELAQKLNLPLHFANNRSELDILISGLDIASKVGIIVDYGVIVSQAVIDTFPLGIVNSHFSLLPEWRGADPITFSILSGQTETGVSLMIIVERLDEGQLIAQEKLPISTDATTPVLTDQLVQKSNEMLAEYLPGYVDGEVEPHDQPNLPASYSRKLTKQDGVLDWSKPAIQLEREIRAFAQWPKSRTTIAGKDVIITEASVAKSQGTSGTVAVEEKRLIVYTGENALSISKLKPAGKKEMTSEAFIAGYKNLLS